uniref:Thioredoxin domain-containing protein n=1 Tax=Oryzias sinensis TaxID=183150 RepID=A0A8C7WVA4_9TELE
MSLEGLIVEVKCFTLFVCFLFALLIFRGTKDDKGTSLCPYSVTAEPNVRGEMSHLPDRSVFSLCLHVFNFVKIYSGIPYY